MLIFLFHVCAAALFLCMSLATGAGVFIHGHDYPPGQYANMLGLSVVSGLVWVWAAMRAKEAWYIARCNRIDGQPH